MPAFELTHFHRAAVPFNVLGEIPPQGVFVEAVRFTDLRQLYIAHLYFPLSLLHRAGSIRLDLAGRKMRGLMFPLCERASSGLGIVRQYGNETVLNNDEAERHR